MSYFIQSNFLIFKEALMRLRVALQANHLNISIITILKITTAKQIKHHQGSVIKNNTKLSKEYIYTGIYTQITKKKTNKKKTWSIFCRLYSKILYYSYQIKSSSTRKTGEFSLFFASKQDNCFGNRKNWAFLHSVLKIVQTCVRGETTNKLGANTKILLNRSC